MVRFAGTLQQATPRLITQADKLSPRRNLVRELVDDPRALTGHAADVITAKNVADVLHRAYPPPAHLWMVAPADPIGRVLRVWHLFLSGEWGLYIRCPDIEPFDSAAEALIKRLGGEYLERYRITRAKNEDRIITDLVEAPRNVLGEAIADEYS